MSLCGRSHQTIDMDFYGGGRGQPNARKRTTPDTWGQETQRSRKPHDQKKKKRERLVQVLLLALPRPIQQYIVQQYDKNQTK